MKHLLIFLLILSASNVIAENKYIIISGYGLDNKYMDLQDDCAEGAICPHSWFKYNIRVENTLRGDKLSGEVVAVKKQHATFVMNKNELAVFVLSEISKKEDQERLNAKYYVHEFSRPKTVYCFNEKIGKLGIESDDEIKYHPIGMWETECVNQAELLSK